jgi:hypothetical protein
VFGESPFKVFRTRLASLCVFARERGHKDDPRLRRPRSDHVEPVTQIDLRKRIPYKQMDRVVCQKELVGGVGHMLTAEIPSAKRYAVDWRERGLSRSFSGTPCFCRKQVADGWATEPRDINLRRVHTVGRFLVRVEAFVSEHLPERGFPDASGANQDQLGTPAGPHWSRS